MRAKRTHKALLFCVLFLFMFVPRAQAITQDEILSRADKWVDKEIMYSQSSYYKGYRQDCSGFVSMAWKLGESRTTSDFDSEARKISKSDLVPGDAVWFPGHLTIFVKWVDKGSTYLCVQESSSGTPANYKKRSISGGTAYRHPKLVTRAELKRREEERQAELARVAAQERHLELERSAAKQERYEDIRTDEDLQVFGLEKVADPDSEIRSGSDAKGGQELLLRTGSEPVYP